MKGHCVPSRFFSCCSSSWGLSVDWDGFTLQAARYQKAHEHQDRTDTHILLQFCSNFLLLLIRCVGVLQGSLVGKEVGGQAHVRERGDRTLDSKIAVLMSMDTP